MSTPVVTVAPDDTLRSLARTLASRHLGGVPVVSGDRVVGVISASDLLAFEGPRAAEPEADAPGEEPPGGASAFWGPGSDFLDAWLGSVAELERRFRDDPVAQGDSLSTHTVSEAMSSRLFALPPDAPVAEAAAYMLRAGIHRVLVMEGDRLLGIVTATDIVRLVAGVPRG